MVFSRYVTIQSLDNENYIMINSISGAVDIIEQKSKDIIDHIKDGIYEPVNDDKELLQQLADRGYIFNNVDDESKYIDKVFNIYSKVIDRKMAKIVICPTLSCNLRCVYCFESLDIRSSKKVMTIQEIDNIFKHIDTILKEKDLEGYEIELFGGEPLLPSTYEVNKHIFELSRSKGRVFL